MGELTYDEWDKILYREIRKERPVLMGISLRALKHFLVCDGYDANKKLSGVRFKVFAENPGLYFYEDGEGNKIKEI